MTDFLPYVFYPPPNPHRFIAPSLKDGDLQGILTTLNFNIEVGVIFVAREDSYKFCGNLLSAGTVSTPRSW